MKLSDIARIPMPSQCYCWVIAQQAPPFGPQTNVSLAPAVGDLSKGTVLLGEFHSVKRAVECGDFAALEVAYRHYRSLWD